MLMHRSKLGYRCIRLISDTFVDINVKLVNMYMDRHLIGVLVMTLLLISCGNNTSVDQQSNSTVKQDEIQQLNDAIKTNPKSGPAYLNRARYYFNKEVYAEAIRDLTSCVEIDSANIECVHLLSDAFLNDNRSRQAIETLEDFIKIEPDHIPTLLKLARFQLIIKRHQAAHFNLNAVLKLEPDHARALLLKGSVFRDEEKTLEAVEYLQRAIQSDPDLSEGHLALGQLFEDAGNPLARKYYENALRVDPENPEAKMALANMYWLNDNIPQALAEYDELLEMHPNFSRGYYNRGLIYLETDSLDLAKSAFERAIQLDNKFILAHYYLGETYGLMNNWKEAQVQLDIAKTLSPTNPRIDEKIREINVNLNK